MTDDLERDSERRFEMCSGMATIATLNGRACELRAPPVFDQPAQARETASARPFLLAQLWHDLCRGTVRFRDTFSTKERHFAVVELTRVEPRAIKASKLDVLQRVILGQTRKAVAIDLNMAPSSVCGAMQDCLRAMGLRCPPSRAPVIFSMAACAALLPALELLVARIDPFDSDSWIVSVRRPELDFPVPLSEAEAAVMRELIAGQSHAQISNLRARSRRTVANQLAMAFRKFGVSGREAVLQRLILHSRDLSAARAMTTADLESAQRYRLLAREVETTNAVKARAGRPTHRSPVDSRSVL